MCDVMGRCGISVASCLADRVFKSTAVLGDTFRAFRQFLQENTKTVKFMGGHCRFLLHPFLTNHPTKKLDPRGNTTSIGQVAASSPQSTRSQLAQDSTVDQTRPLPYHCLCLPACLITAQAVRIQTASLNKLQLDNELNERLAAKLRSCFVAVCTHCLISASGAQLRADQSAAGHTL